MRETAVLKVGHFSSGYNYWFQVGGSQFLTVSQLRTLMKTPRTRLDVCHEAIKRKKCSLRMVKSNMPVAKAENSLPKLYKCWTDLETLPFHSHFQNC